MHAMSDARLTRGLAAGATLALFLAGAASSCSGTKTSFPNADGGAGGSQVAAGTGGGGGAATGCDNCGGATPVCVDDVCVADCPEQRAVCHPSAAAGDADVCCAQGEQCCTAAVNGYAADMCLPAGEQCPVACPDGVTACSSTQFCQLDAATMSYSCAEDCAPQNICAGTVCCPLGSRCDAGACALPDLTIDAPRIVSSARMERLNFAPDACEIVEGCVQGSGERTLLRFDLESPNIGLGDLVLGDPGAQTDLFSYSQCHNHFHFDSYANYTLLGAQNNVVAVGHKQAFCLLDWRPYLPGAPQDAVYDCTFQGIQAGWSDVYDSELACQWVDVTDVPPGDYKLEVRVNFDQVLGESDYSNNIALVDVTIPADSCPNGCRAYDAACCNDGDTCGYANDGSCDCMGAYTWDAADCATCLDCPAQTSCTGGCTPNSGPSCTAANPGALDNNGVCDCAGAFAWDDGDCGDCVSNDPDCPAVDSCPNGCDDGAQEPQCCSESTDVCGYANDGWCDCGGSQAAGWDYIDCSSCACN